MRHPYSFSFLMLLLYSIQPANAQPDLDLNEITTVNQPVDITGAGDGSGRLFIVDKSGKIRIYDLNSSSLLSGNFLNISTQVHNSGERGLLGLAFHPDYETNGQFYVNYVYTGSNTTRISKFVVHPPSSNVVDTLTQEILLTIPQPFSNHKGGDLNFGPDGYLYIGLGDGGDAGDPGDRAQDGQELLGKMLRIDVNTPTGYLIPPDNPFEGSESPEVLDEIWALGLRNPWRFSFDRSTGDMWIADVGQGNWEELNFQPASSTGGENYGWRCYEGNHNFNIGGCGPMGQYDGPIFEYSHNPTTGGNSVTGGFVYRGSNVPSLQGWYVMADYTSDNFWLIKPNGSGWTVDLQTNVPVVDMVSFGEDDDGELYASSLNGKIYSVDAVLPIELLTFKGILRDGQAQLAWTTATEKNSAYFEVERKSEGGAYEPVGRVTAAGESLSQQAYTFSDPLLAPGENLYRLKMVEFDGNFVYSPVVSILVKETARWKLLPNPTSGQVSLLMAEKPANSSLQFEITNLRGERILHHVESEPEFPYSREFDLADLPRGIYFCRLNAGGRTEVKRLILAR